MTQELLDLLQRHLIKSQNGGKGVPQIVKNEVVDLGRFQSRPKCLSNRLSVSTLVLPRRGEKEATLGPDLQKQRIVLSVISEGA